MDKKFSIEEIAEILAAKTGKETTAIEKFLNEFALIVNEGITSGNIVKIKGLGVFKVVLVKERESVHVNTGERILIPPHHKITFIPEKKLKDTINKPFAAFEVIEAQEEDGFMNLTVSENEDTEIQEIKEAGIQELEVKQEIDEKTDEVLIQQTEPQPYIVAEPPPPPLKEPAPPIFIEEPPAPPLEEPVPPIFIEEPPAPPLKESAPPIIIEERPTSPPPPVSSPPKPPLRPVKQHIKKKKRSKQSSTTLLWIILFFLLFVLIGGVIWYFFFYSKSWDDYDLKLSSRIQGNEIVAPSADSIKSDTAQETSPLVTDSLLNVPPQTETTDTIIANVSPSTEAPVSGSPETPPARQEPAAQPTTNPPATTTSPQATTTSSGSNVLASVRIQSGQRLTLLAERYYGNKVFWVYIYEYNKEKIGSNPDRIAIGTEILIPAKELYGIDPNSNTSIEKATDLQHRIMTREY